MGANRTRRLNPVPEKNIIFFFLYIFLFFFVANFRSQLKTLAYRKTGPWTLAKPNNQDPGPLWDPSGTLEKPENQDLGP